MMQCSEITYRWKWVISILSLIGAALSVWLSIEKLNGTITTLAGCGSGSGCANVLGSRWSMVFGVIPVSIFSSLLYVGILVSLRSSHNTMTWFRQLAAWVIIGSAVWFTVLQLGVIGSFCKYCMTMHGVGVLLAMAILLAEHWKAGRFVKHTVVALPAAMVFVACLAMIQYYGPQPQTHRLDTIVVDASEADIHAQGQGRAVVFFGGEKSYRVSELPHIGPADADHVIVKYYDYTCDACRKMHENLDGLLEKYQGQLAVILLPTPLNRNCNPELPLGVTDHEKACEFAYLALRIWRANPQKFSDFHDWLFENREVPVEAAEAMAASLVGEDRLPPADDPWVNEIVKQNVMDYKAFSQNTHVLPKLAIKGAIMMQGGARTQGELENELKKQLILR